MYTFSTLGTLIKPFDKISTTLSHFNSNNPIIKANDFFSSSNVFSHSSCDKFAVLVSSHHRDSRGDGLFSPQWHEVSELTECAEEPLQRLQHGPASKPEARPSETATLGQRLLRSQSRGDWVITIRSLHASRQGHESVPVTRHLHHIQQTERSVRGGEIHTDKYCGL